jgi:FtsP/CotA-like multicopper oxidase with cupredoxin domain
MLPITFKETKMKKIFLISIMFCSSVFSFGQHDMKNMPGMKMNKQQSTPVKKPTNAPLSKDTTPVKEHQMPMGMNMPEQKEGGQDSSFIPETVDMSPGKTVRYDLYVRDTIVNYTGKKKHAIAVNGSIPMPTLVFTEGDTAEIYLHNELKTETSLHWHGVRLPNHEDGVPYLTTAPIPPGTTHLYKFAVVQNGTYWYHSHSAFQEQIGMNGALIFKKREAQASPEREGKEAADYTIVLTEWTDEAGKVVQRHLRSANDWFAIKKGSMQSYAEAIQKGYFKTKVINEWKRMKAMDVSDVYYEKFLVNGHPEARVPQFKSGQKVKLHIVNGGTSTYFWLQFAGGKLTVVGNDGNDVEPVEVDRMIIAPSETYDVEVTIPQDMSYEFRATSEDRTGHSSLWLGSGMKMPAPTLPHLKYFEGMKMMNDMMKMNGDMKTMEGMNMTNQTMDMNTVMYPEITGYEKGKSKDEGMPGMDMGNSSDIVTLNYAMLRSPVKTTLPDVHTKELRFVLTGNMNRYVWSINNRTLNETDKILIMKGENVRIILVNNSMMRHPMHLHGHDFRLINDQGEYAPLKNVVDIMPMETDTLEFAGSESGDWFFHCHILYHMMAGIGRVFSYENSPPNPELPDSAKAYRKFERHNMMIHPMAMIGLESNGSDATFALSGNRYALEGLWHLGLKPMHGYEAELNFGRYFGKMQWLFPYVGYDYHYRKTDKIEKNSFGQISNKNNRKTFVAGVQYTLPMLLVADARIDGDGKLRFQLGREDIPVTSRLRFNFMVNTDKEYAAGFRYILSSLLALSTHYDSDMGLGAGITLIY